MRQTGNSGTNITGQVLAVGPSVSVLVDRRWQYELWAGNGTRHGMELSLVGAIEFYDRVKPVGEAGSVR